MPQNIGPELRLARPRTHIGMVSLSTRTSARSGKSARAGRMSACTHVSSAPGVRKRSHEEGDYHIELLEYEWPDLPPIIHMKDAVTRRRVSQGINYILPVDKGKNSIDSTYRTDLRAMFQEPYATEGFGYDDDRVTESAKVHFKTNVVDTQWTKDHFKKIPVHLNSDSENVRKLYAHSAPAGGRTKSGMKEDQLKTRSSLFLPIKAKDQPEATRLRKEVDKIIKSVQEDNDEYDSEDDAETESDNDDSSTVRVSSSHRKSIMRFRHPSHVIQEDVKPHKEKRIGLTATKFDSYEQLKHSKPPKAIIPEQFRSEYLSTERNQEIWDWLHYGESITDFEYFLSICG